MGVRQAFLFALAGAVLAFGDEAQPRTFPGTRAKLRIPEGFVQREGLPILVSESHGAILSALEGIAPDPKDVLRTIEEAAFAGQDILERKELKVSGHAARLLKLQTRPATPNRTIWALIACEKARMLTVQVGVDGAGEDALGKALQAMLSSAEWDLAAPADVGSIVDAEVAVPEGLSAIATFLSRDKSGAGVEFASGLLETGMRDPAAVQWTVQRFPTQTKPSQLEGECRARLWENHAASKAEELVSHAVEVAGCAGWEIEARDKRGSGKPAKVWHQLVILRTPTALMHFQGSAPVADSDKWLPKFREAARSWKPRK